MSTTRIAVLMYSTQNCITFKSTDGNKISEYCKVAKAVNQYSDSDTFSDNEVTTGGCSASTADTFVHSACAPLDTSDPFYVPYTGGDVPSNSYQIRAFGRMIVAANAYAANNGFRYARFIAVNLDELTSLPLPDVFSTKSQYVQRRVETEHLAGINLEYHGRIFAHSSVFALCPVHAMWFIQTCAAVFGDNGGGAVDVSRLFAMNLFMAPRGRDTFLSAINHAFPGEMECINTI
jgi:hypothetical protein